MGKSDRKSRGTTNRSTSGMISRGQLCKQAANYSNLEPKAMSPKGFYGKLYQNEPQYTSHIRFMHVRINTGYQTLISGAQPIRVRFYKGSHKMQNKWFYFDLKDKYRIAAKGVPGNPPRFLYHPPSSACNMRQPQCKQQCLNVCGLVTLTAALLLLQTWK